MRKILLTMLMAMVFLQLDAQDLHQPFEILQILEKSKLNYEVISSKESLGITDYTKANEPYFYQQEKDGQLLIKEYEISDTEQAILDQAEKAFTGGQWNEARELYKKVLETKSDFSVAMTYIGQTYGIEKNHDRAIEWYTKAIKSSYINYLAHWFLADIYKQKKMKKESVREITIAYVLNRNNPRLKSAVEEIYKAAGLKYQDWEFNPGYKLVPSSDTTRIQIHYNEEWLAYALCKAVWKFEPGYRKQMVGSSDATISSTEERECLVNLVIGHKNAHKDKKSKEEAINKLLDAVDAKRLDEFMLFEVMLRQYPIIAYSQSRKLIEEVAEYVIDSRSRK